MRNEHKNALSEARGVQYKGPSITTPAESPGGIIQYIWFVYYNQVSYLHSLVLGTVIEW